MADNGYANEVLVSTDWVTEHLDDPNVVVAEVGRASCRERVWIQV